MVEAQVNRRTHYFERVRLNFNKARDLYRAKPAPIPTLLIQTAQRAEHKMRYERWKALAQAQMEVEVIPDTTHRSLLVENEAHIQHLAMTIQTHLSTLETEPGKKHS